MIKDQIRKGLNSNFDDSLENETVNQNNRFIHSDVMEKKVRKINANMSIELGGFHLVAKIIRELKIHMIPYKFKCSRGLPINRLIGLSRSFLLIGLGFGHLIFWTKYLA